MVKLTRLISGSGEARAGRGAVEAADGGAGAVAPLDDGQGPRRHQTQPRKFVPQGQ